MPVDSGLFSGPKISKCVGFPHIHAHTRPQVHVCLFEAEQPFVIDIDSCK